MKKLTNIGIPVLMMTGTVALVLVSLFGGNIEAQIQGPTVSGWAWSNMPDQSDELKGCTDNDCGRGMGWISLNNPGFGGAVTVDDQGNFSGHAWSEFAGWIDFAPQSGYPTGPGTTAGPAKVDPETGIWTGWIRVISPIGNTNANGWDGWISLRGTGYGVTTNIVDGTTSGWAWGDAVMGWVKFDWVKVEFKECLDADGDGFDDVTKELCNEDADTTAVQLTSTACGVNGEVTLYWETIGEVETCTIYEVSQQLAPLPASLPSGSQTVGGLVLNQSYRFLLQCETTDSGTLESPVNFTCQELPGEIYDCGPGNRPNGINEDGDDQTDEDCPRLNPIYIHR
jgi:hypothetical protein